MKSRGQGPAGRLGLAVSLGSWIWVDAFDVIGAIVPPPDSDGDTVFDDQDWAVPADFMSAECVATSIAATSLTVTPASGNEFYLRASSGPSPHRERHGTIDRHGGPRVGGRERHLDLVAGAHVTEPPDDVLAVAVQRRAMAVRRSLEARRQG
jgi:hypothetical protein